MADTEYSKIHFKSTVYWNFTSVMTCINLLVLNQGLEAVFSLILRIKSFQRLNNKNMEGLYQEESAAEIRTNRQFRGVNHYSEFAIYEY